MQSEYVPRLMTLFTVTIFEILSLAANEVPKTKTKWFAETFPSTPQKSRANEHMFKYSVCDFQIALVSKLHYLHNLVFQIARFAWHIACVIEIVLECFSNSVGVSDLIRRRRGLYDKSKCKHKCDPGSRTFSCKVLVYFRYDIIIFMHYY